MVLNDVYRVSRQKSVYSVHSYGKLFPNGVLRLFVYSNPILKQQAGLEKPQKFQPSPSTTPPVELEQINNFERSLRRTRTLISDLTYSNSFDLFCTFTFKHDRQNIEKCKQKMSNWLHSQQKQYGKFEYLIIPEFHKDGKSLHFHALIKNYKGQLVATNVYQKGKRVYNFKSYKLGFTNVSKIESVPAVSSYIRKYITKDMPVFPGRKRYWCSRNLERPRLVYNLQPSGLMIKKYQTELCTTYEGLPTVEQLEIINYQDILSLQTN